MTRELTKREANREAMWECFWMVFHGQARIVTFHNIRNLGFSPREAAEYIHDCEKED
jgi:hypothetical protein